jgi:hypothetical protein
MRFISTGMNMFTGMANTPTFTGKRTIMTKRLAGKNDR